MTDKELKYSTGSWHYRLVDYTWDYAPRNLCAYLRLLLLSFVCCPLFFVWRKMPELIQEQDRLCQILFIYGILVHFSMFMITVVSGGVITNYEATTETIGTTTVRTAVETKITIEWWWGWAFYFISILAVSALIGFTIGVLNLLDKIKHKKQNDPNMTRTIDLFTNYVHAKHNKICPRINFIDEEKNE